MGRTAYEQLVTARNFLQLSGGDAVIAKLAIDKYTRDCNFYHDAMTACNQTTQHRIVHTQPHQPPYNHCSHHTAPRRIVALYPSLSPHFPPLAHNPHIPIIHTGNSTTLSRSYVYIHIYIYVYIPSLGASVIMSDPRTGRWLYKITTPLN